MLICPVMKLITQLMPMEVHTLLFPHNSYLIPGNSYLHWPKSKVSYNRKFKYPLKWSHSQQDNRHAKTLRVLNEEFTVKKS